MKKLVMKKYAQLVVRSGANIKKGQGCLIYAQVEQFEFARLVQEEAYKAGAEWTEIMWMDQPSKKLKYKNESLETLSTVTDWQKARLQYYVDNLPARIHIISEDPDGMKGVDIDKMQKANAAAFMETKSYSDAMDNLHQWTIAAVPSDKWAKKVFPGDRVSTAVEKLWEAILSSVRVAEVNNPIQEWEEHNARLSEKSAKLNSYKFDYLHYQSENGTDFKCWLMPQSKWTGGSETIKDGTVFNPNMPTEEVFTTPMKGKCEGTLVATMPLSYQGNLIENFSITFENGRAVSCKATNNQELLEKMIAMDDGAAMLGELALVPHDSPISNSGILFYNTLFDENASCHVALGRGYDNAVEGYEDKTKEELQKMGVNDSIIHVDFMIGNEKLNITGHTKDGKAVQIFKDGNWAI